MSDNPEAQVEPTDVTDTAASEPQAPAVDWGELEQRLGPMFDQKLAAFQQQQAEPEPEPDPYAEHLDPLYDDPAEAAAARQTLQSIIDSAVEQRLAPEREARLRLETELEYGDLETKYPGLQEPAVQQEVVAEAARVFQALGGGQNQPVPAPLIEQAYLARIGRERAQSEAPAGGHATALETAGGAAPPVPEADIAQSIVNANGPRTPGRSFWAG